ncbi:hypothetical protein ABVG11_26730 [Streptomyces sp. HD1123-B1]|uniref:hypothetical protein n=1 Tax=Streptomyces huangiella TaxID=3228804 RepID=UPI003D7E77ED
MADEMTPPPGDDLAVVLTDEGLVVQDASRRHVFRGRAAVMVLPRLFPLLDGEHPQDEPLTGDGLSDRRLHRILAMLNARLSAEPPAGPPSTDVMGHIRRYFAPDRTRDTAAGHSGPAALLDTLAGSAAAVVGSTGAARRIADDLREAGIGRVHHVARALGRDQLEPVREAARRLVLCVEEPHDDGDPHTPDPLADTVASCGRGQFPQIPVMRLAAGRGGLEVGPVFFPGYAVCVDCFRRRREATGWGPPAPTAPVGDALAALAGGEALAFLLRTTAMRAPRRVTRISLDECSAASFVTAPGSGCPDCPPRPAVPAVGDDARTGG